MKYITDFDRDVTDHSLRRAYQKISDSDGLLVFVDDDIKSEGMLVEIGFAYKKVPIYLCKKEGLGNNRFEDLASSTAFWNDEGCISEVVGQLIKD